MCPVTHTYAENGDLATSREYMEFDTKADLQGVSPIRAFLGAAAVEKIYDNG